MKRAVCCILFLLICFGVQSHAQESSYDAEAIEVFLIDAYVKHEAPHSFVLSFFTSDSCTSKVVLDDKYDFVVSKELTDDHKTEIEFNGIRFDSASAPFNIHVIGKNGEEYVSETYELHLPFNVDLNFTNAPGLFEVCCFGGIFFGIPSPTYINENGTGKFALTKEVPVISFYSVGYNYPAGYLSLEYQYVFEADNKHFLRTGYKHIFQLPVIEFVSPGAGAFSDLNGFNGLSAEVALGLFRIYNVFTLYSKYRYNFQTCSGGRDFHEISIGLYSNFFSLNL